MSSSNDSTAKQSAVSDNTGIHRLQAGNDYPAATVTYSFGGKEVPEVSASQRSRLTGEPVDATVESGRNHASLEAHFKGLGKAEDIDKFPVDKQEDLVHQIVSAELAGKPELDAAPTKTERSRNHYSILIGIGRDETAELVLHHDAYRALMRRHDKKASETATRYEDAGFEETMARLAARESRVPSVNFNLTEILDQIDDALIDPTDIAADSRDKREQYGALCLVIALNQLKEEFMRSALRDLDAI